MGIPYRFVFLAGIALIIVGWCYWLSQGPWAHYITSFSTSLGNMMSVVTPVMGFLNKKVFQSDPQNGPDRNTVLTLPQAYHLSGVAILIGGLLIGIQNLIPNSGPSLLTSALLLLQCTAMIFGLPGFYARLWNRTEWSGAIGVIAIIGSLIILFIKTILPPNFSSGHPALFNTFSATQLYFLGAGTILLGISIIRAVVYPRWTGVALLIGALMYLLLNLIMEFLPPVNTDVSILSSTLPLLIISVAYIRCAFTLLNIGESAVPA